MTYESLVNYAKDIAENLTTNETIQFFHGRKEVLHELPEVPDHSPNRQWCGYISKLNST